MKKLILFSCLIVSLIAISLASKNAVQKVGLDLGNKAPELNTQLIKGEDFSLDSLRGKMVLLDFWASYSGKCRSENYLKPALQNKYSNTDFFKAKGFDIVSVSLDIFKSPLKKAIEQDNISELKQICDFKGKNSGIAKRFDVSEPTMILLDGEGRIIARSSSLDEIERKIEFMSQYKGYSEKLSE